MRDNSSDDVFGQRKLERGKPDRNESAVKDRFPVPKLSGGRFRERSRTATKKRERESEKGSTSQRDEPIAGGNALNWYGQLQKQCLFEYDDGWKGRSRTL